MDEFGQELSDAEVQEIAIRLLRFFNILHRPDSDALHPQLPR